MAVSVLSMTDCLDSTVALWTMTDVPWFSNFGDKEVAVTSIPFAYLITLVHETYSTIFLVEYKSIFAKLSIENHDFWF